MEYATLAQRFAATLIDSAVLFFALVIMLRFAASMGALELPDPATTSPFDIQSFFESLSSARLTPPTWVYFAMYGLLFGYYAVLEGLTGGSLGKLALGLRVRMDDGSEPTGTAIVVRNLVRVAEAFVWYIPAGISCLLSSRNKRLGDYAAGTVVVRRTTALVVRRGALPLSKAPSPPRTTAVHDSAPPLPAAAPVEPSPQEAIALLKAAALAARGAHAMYLRFSEVELAKERPATSTASDSEPQYSPEYVAAWYSLADAVLAMNEARATAIAASTRAGSNLDAALVAQPDLVYLLRELAPYLAEDATERLHEAYMRVVQGETQK